MQTNTESMTRSESKREFWQEHINQWQKSGLAQPAYCDQQQISYTTFGYWRSQLRRESGEYKQKKFVSVAVKQTQEDLAQSIKVKLTSGLVISMPCSMGTASIAELIRMLEIPHA